MNELLMLAIKWNTGKVGGIDLASFYHELLSDRRQEVRKVLEIGIGHAIQERNGFMHGYNGYKFGASLRMWKEYFPGADIYGLDILPEIMLNEGRIHSYVCNQGDVESLKETAKILGDGFDLIVDDGSHVPEHQILTANKFVPLLSPQGIYVIEDLWPERSNEVRRGIAHPSEVKDMIDAEGNVGDRLIVIRGSR